MKVEFSGSDDWQGEGEVEIVLADGTVLSGAPDGASNTPWPPLSDGQFIGMAVISNGMNESNTSHLSN